MKELGLEGQTAQMIVAEVGPGSLLAPFRFLTLRQCRAVWGGLGVLDNL